jgi:hypothetical protein
MYSLTPVTFDRMCLPAVQPPPSASELGFELSVGREEVANATRKASLENVNTHDWLILGGAR